MTELHNLFWAEKYRPKRFEDLILDNKATILNYLNNPKSIPSFIFYSSNPGTGKTSTAFLIAQYLNCDLKKINSSDERGIDTIRDEVKMFARSLSMSNNKRCIFMDEADSMTRPAQDSLRNLMEEYADNCFFIFTANDISKIIQPIQSRCQIINFERPNKADIFNRLMEISLAEQLKIENLDSLSELIDVYYPDIRKMVSKLQECKVDSKDISIADEKIEFEKFIDLMKKKDIKSIYEKVYSGSFEMMQFNKWYFTKLFNEYKVNEFEKTRQIAIRLADTEKAWNLGTNLEVVFLSNILEIIKLL
jgi:replication factor C small subunit